MPTATDESHEPTVEEIAEAVVKDTACIDEVAQSIVKDLQNQQDPNIAPECVEKPVVPCVHRPESHSEVKQEDVGAGGEEAAGVPTDDLVAAIPNPPQPQYHQGHATAPQPTEDGIASSPPNRSFPELLYEIISNPATDDVCSWLPHGKGFMIHDKVRFDKEILPQYFEGTKFTR